MTTAFYFRAFRLASSAGKTLDEARAMGNAASDGSMSFTSLSPWLRRLAKNAGFGSRTDLVHRPTA